MRNLWIGAGLAGGLALLSRSQFEISHTIDLAAPPARVWEVLVDFPSYARWNSQLHYLGGEARPGGTLTLRLAVPGTTAYEFSPRISAWEEQRQFAWIGRTAGIPRLFDGEHFFTLSPLPNGGTRLTNREEYRGILAPIFQRLPMMEAAPQGFQRMNEELAAYLSSAP